MVVLEMLLFLIGVGGAGAVGLSLIEPAMDWAYARWPYPSERPLIVGHLVGVLPLLIWALALLAVIT